MSRAAKSTIIIVLNFLICAAVLFGVLQLFLPGNITDTFKSNGYTVTIFGVDALSSAYDVNDTKIDGNKVISTGDDSFFAIDVSGYDRFKFIRLNISGLESDTNALGIKYSRAQVYWVHSGEYFSESRTQRFPLINGTNKVQIQNDGVITLRFDLSTTPNVSFNLESVTFTNNYYLMPIIIIAVIGVSMLWVLCVLEVKIFNSKHIKKVAGLFDTDGSQISFSVLGDLFKHSKLFWVCTTITAFVCNAFNALNPVISIDDEMFLLGKYNTVLLSQGRWQYFFFKQFYEFPQAIAVLSQLLFVVCTVIGICIYLKLFNEISGNRISETAKTLFSCGLLSFSYIAHCNIFYMCIVQLYGVFLLSAICAYVFYGVIIRSINRVFGGVVYIIACQFVGEYGLQVIVVNLFVILTLLLYYDTENRIRTKQFIAHIILAGILTIVSVIVYSGVGRLLRTIYNVPHSSYTSNMISYKLSDGIMGNIIKLFDCYRVFSDDTGFVILILCVAVVIITAAISFLRKSYFLCVSSIFLCFSQFCLAFLTGNFELPYRSRICQALFFAVALLLIYETLKVLNFRVKNFRISLKSIVAICGFAFIIIQCKITNEIYYVDWLRYQWDLDISRNIVVDVAKINTERKPVLILGWMDFTNAMNVNFEVAGHSFFVWDRFYRLDVELGSDRIIDFLKVHGYSLVIATDYDKTQAITNFNSMPAYPYGEYVKDCGNYILVKIGNSTLLSKEIMQ